MVIDEFSALKYEDTEDRGIIAGHAVAHYKLARYKVVSPVKVKVFSQGYKITPTLKMTRLTSNNEKVTFSLIGDSYTTDVQSKEFDFAYDIGQYYYKDVTPLGGGEGCDVFGLKSVHDFRFAVKQKIIDEGLDKY